MSRHSDIIALSRLTDAAFAARQAGMGALRQQEQDLRDKLAALDAARNARAAGLTEADPALLAGADLLWQSWIETRKSALNGALARNRVAQEAARAALRLAFGRHQATLGLIKQSATARTKAKARRDDMTS